MAKCRVYVVDPDVRSLSRMVPALADQGFEVAGGPSETDPLGKLEAGPYDIVLSIIRGPSGDTQGPGALLLCRLKSSASPIGLLCQGVPLVMATDRPADLKKAISDQAARAADAALDRSISLFLQLVQAMDQTADLSNGIPRPALQVIAQAIAADQTGYFQVDRSGGLQLHSSYTRDGSAPLLLKTLVSEALEGKRAVLASKTSSPAPRVAAELNESGVLAAIGIPIVTGGEAQGAFTAAYTRPGQPVGDGRLETASLLVRIAAALLENRRLRQSETKRMEQTTQSTNALEQRQREIKALNTLLQGQHGRMKALEEKACLHQERYLSAVRLLTAMQEESGSLARGHAEAVATWAVAMAKAMDLPLEGLAEGAYLHDIGKARGIRAVIAQTKGVPAIAGETGGAAEDAYRAHPLVGEEVSRLLKLPPEWGQSIRNHHENYDGSGFPDGIAGDRIPLGARIIGLADAYVTYTHPSQKSAGKEVLKATDYFRKSKGSLFDPAITDVLLRMLQKNETPTETEMISTVSHELRSPLTYLVGYSELLAGTQDLPESAQKVAKEIYTEAQHMARIVEDMLDLSRIEAGHARIDARDVEVAPLIERALAKARLKSSKHQVDAELPAALGKVKADPDRLLQVLDNLLDNAIKYSPEGGAVKVRATVRQAEMLISVSDQGIGIPKDKLEVVFEKFQRLDSPLKNKVAGTGIGLNLCRRLIEAQGGRIWAESEEGRGSVIYFTLPWASPVESP